MPNQLYCQGALPWHGKAVGHIAVVLTVHRKYLILVSSGKGSPGGAAKSTRSGEKLQDPRKIRQIGDAPQEQSFEVS